MRCRRHLRHRSPLQISTFRENVYWAMGVLANLCDVSRTTRYTARCYFVCDIVVGRSIGNSTKDDDK